MLKKIKNPNNIFKKLFFFSFSNKCHIYGGQHTPNQLNIFQYPVYYILLLHMRVQWTVGLYNIYPKLTKICQNELENPYFLLQITIFHIQVYIKKWNCHIEVRL